MAQIAKRTADVPGAGRMAVLNARAAQEHDAFLGASALARRQEGFREPVEDDRRRGRGSTLNPSGRFEPISRHVFDDGWQTIDELPAFRTEVQVE